MSSMQKIVSACFLLVLFFCCTVVFASEPDVPEPVYTGDLIRYPGPWAFQLGRSGIILVSDQDLEDLTDPDKKIDLSTSYNKQINSLREICERAQKHGHRTLIVAFDHFFSQYRPGQTTPRKLTPDMDEYVEKIAKISRFAQSYGLGLELSLLSPLEVGPAYAKSTGESGRWMHYRKGLRDPQTGAYSVQLWKQTKWANNKGAVQLQDLGVRVFAFREQRVGGTPYIAVDPNAIVEITPTAQVEHWPTLAEDRGDYRAERIRVYGSGMTQIGPLDRVLVVQQYQTPEMDYFSDRALPYLKNLVDKYVNAGVKLNALYSDEMHIQQDWGYFNHHDNGEFALRYVSEGLAAAYAHLYGGQFHDFAKYLIYFVEGQEDYRNDMQAKLPLMHVMGSSPENIRRTALFRSRYYRLLQEGVVDLFAQAKQHAEQRYGYRLESRAHATWAESPTIDYWNGGEGNHYRRNYEYTSDFLWSNTVHQAASACQDYFEWGEFLTGNGNDHCECGWLDRNYTGITLACSTGIINSVPHSYSAHWGMPDALSQRRMALVTAAGASGYPYFTTVQDAQHRDTDVLTLYPIDLVSVDEHFGSWMTQYAYANYITQTKLLQKGRVQDGKILLAGRTFGTLTIAFEPFPSQELMKLIRELAESGGRVVWCGPPPVLSREGEPILSEWKDLFGVDYEPERNEGQIAVGNKVEFAGLFSKIEPQIILTHYLVDHIYPVRPGGEAQPVAKVQNQVVGTHKSTTQGGSLTFLGFRPRDDQAQSLGYDIRTWFNILTALGAYPSSGNFENTNDNTDFLSRTSDYFVCRFPNGTVALAPHLKNVEEDWNGGFARNQERDQQYLKQNPPPSDDIDITDFKANGHAVTYKGKQGVAYRTDSENRLIAFAGYQCSGIKVDEHTYTFSDTLVPLVSFAPVPSERQMENGAIYIIRLDGTGTIQLPIPNLPESFECVTEGSTPGSRGQAIAHEYVNGELIFTVTPEISGRWIYVVKGE